MGTSVSPCLPRLRRLLPGRLARLARLPRGLPLVRGLHSSSFQLNLCRFGPPVLSPCLIDWGKTMHRTYPTECAYVEPKSERV